MLRRPWSRFWCRRDHNINESFESLTKTDMIDAYWHVNVRTYNVWRWFMRRKIAGKAFFWSQECFQKPFKTILYPKYIGEYLACLHSNKIFLVLNISNSFFSETSLRNLCKNLIIESCSCMSLKIKCGLVS